MGNIRYSNRVVLETYRLIDKIYMLQSPGIFLSVQNNYPGLCGWDLIKGVDRGGKIPIRFVPRLASYGLFVYG